MTRASKANDPSSEQSVDTFIAYGHEAMLALRLADGTPVAARIFDPLPGGRIRPSGVDGRLPRAPGTRQHLPPYQAYNDKWVNALSRAATRKGDPGVHTPGPLPTGPMEAFVVALPVLLILVAAVLGIIGVTGDGLGYLLVIGIVLFAATATFVAVRKPRRAKRRNLR
ncbi:hypothetical protein RM704_31450 [Streptomyces sp. DSM 3412]|uniref:Integral membrane protein n=1 Tax=Streptomyces gottesmaniae TaxID=3075518 RepID=A0ABU2Z5Q9_9ACTN|nr:hypothetical protein [Streptomyces sp. DSM 3412]MDT0571917.1 hypothetical protein [Streptomyces sp. DSM 3412]